MSKISTLNITAPTHGNLCQVIATEDYGWSKIPDDVLGKPNLEELLKDYFIWREPIENIPMLVWCRKIVTREYGATERVLGTTTEYKPVKISSIPLADL